MFEKYLRTIFGVSSSESVELKMNFEMYFPGFYMFFFLKPTLKESCWSK